VPDALAGAIDRSARVREVGAVGELEVDVGLVRDDREQQIAHRPAAAQREEPVAEVDLLNRVGQHRFDRSAHGVCSRDHVGRIAGEDLREVGVDVRVARHWIEGRHPAS
jgi:hypothetical protein